MSHTWLYAKERGLHALDICGAPVGGASISVRTVRADSVTKPFLSHYAASGISETKFELLSGGGCRSPFFSVKKGVCFGVRMVLPRTKVNNQWWVATTITEVNHKL